MRYEWAISLRYFRSPRAEGAVSFITRVAIGGVTLGVAALVVAMAVMNGYRANLIRAMAGALPHVSLHALEPGSLPEGEALAGLFPETLPPVTASTFTRKETLLAGPHPGRGTVQGVLIRAIDTEVEQRVTDLLAFLSDGSPEWAALPPAERLARARRLLLRLQERAPDGSVPVLLSAKLAGRLGAGLGERLTPLELPAEGAGFTPEPSGEALRLIGHFTSGIASIDEFFVLMDVRLVEAVFPGEPVQRAVGVRLAEPLQASRAAEALREELRRRDLPVYVFSWLENNRGLFGVIRLQKVMLFLVLMLIVVIAFFGMISGLVMLVSEKSREITILKSLGARDAAINRIFILQGLLVGLVGTGLGIALGLGVCWVLDTFPLFTIPPGVYPGSDRVPVRVEWLDLTWVLIATFLTCLAATWFPARKARALQPAEGLRAE